MDCNMGKVLAQEEPCPVAGIMPWPPPIGGAVTIIGISGHVYRNTQR